MRQVFLDTETTGLNAAGGDRIVEVGCIEFVDRRPSGRTLHHYVNPGRPSHPDAVRIHGITDEFLADKPPFETVAQALAEFVDGAEVVIHNAAFDCGFIDAEFERLGLPRLVRQAARVTDSLLMAREMFPGKANSLDALCKRLEVDNSGRDLHGALLDAGLLAEVYLRMTRGQGMLVIDGGSGGGSTGGLGGAAAPAADLRDFALPVVEPSEAEWEAHRASLVQLAKAARQDPVWADDLPAPAASAVGSMA